MDPHTAVQSPLNYCQDVVRIGGTNVLLGEAIASTKQSCVAISDINQWLQKTTSAVCSATI